MPDQALISVARQILWSGRGDRGAGIWRLVPGESEPELIFKSAHDDGRIPAITASAAGYAFIELSESGFGEGGWRLSFLPGAGEVPKEIDRGMAPRAGVAPTIDMDDARIVWASFDEPPSGPRSRLKVVSVGNLSVVTTLLDAPIEQRLLWYPALSGDELWYGTIKADFVGTADPEYHLEHFDLAAPAAGPARFPGFGLDFYPVLHDGFMVWRTNAQGDSALNWGALHVLDRRSEALATIPVEHANHPSLGGRFVAFDEITHSRLAVYDIRTGRLVDLANQVGGGAHTYGSASLSGRLLTFSTQAGDGTGLPQIRWAMLPD